MSAVDILLEINKLPLGERLWLLEKVVYDIRLNVLAGQQSPPKYEP